mmetsp:Transcript_52654/g.85353  ORF Transcript_52654/g.85353 Transcript_52654/m.85353 type:complete len:211 (+) Transcript_52654:2556-3188(+)
MRLVDLQVFWTRWPCVLHDVSLTRRRFPHDAVEQHGGLILPCQLGPSRDTVKPIPELTFYLEADKRLVRDHPSPRLVVRKVDGPATKPTTFQWVSALPTVKLADEENLLCLRQPLCKSPLFGSVISVKPELLIALRKFDQAAFILVKLFLPATVGSDPLHDVPFIGTQCWVIFEDGKHPAGELLPTVPSYSTSTIFHPWTSPPKPSIKQS